MAIVRHIMRLQFIDFLIKRKATGDLATFARKNHLSKSCLQQILSEMKEMGFPIQYNRMRHTYYYTKKGQMVKKLFMENTQVLSREETRAIDKINNVNNLCFSETSIFKPCDTSGR